MNRKDYRIDIAVRNANIFRAMRAKGIETAADLSKATGVSNSNIGMLINMKISPYRESDGELRSWVARICEFLNVMPCDLFSEEQLTPLETNKSYYEVSAEQMFALVGSEDAIAQIEQGDMRQLVAESMNNMLTPREERVVRMRYGFDTTEMTLEEVSKELGICRSRVRQIEAKALRKLRHENYSGPLREYIR